MTSNHGNDPLRNYKFDVTARGYFTYKFGAMAVSGLRSSPESNLVITTGYVPGATDLVTMWKLKGTPLADHYNLDFNINDGLRLTALNALPVEIAFTDLDAGGNELLCVQVAFAYEGLEIDD